jgi:hypothetical protein
VIITSGTTAAAAGLVNVVKVAERFSRDHDAAHLGLLIKLERPSRSSYLIPLELRAQKQKQNEKNKGKDAGLEEVAHIAAHSDRNKAIGLEVVLADHGIGSSSSAWSKHGMTATRSGVARRTGQAHGDGRAGVVFVSFRCFAFRPCLRLSSPLGPPLGHLLVWRKAKKSPTTLGGFRNLAILEGANDRRPFLFGQLAQSSPNQIIQCPSHLDVKDCQKPNGRATTRLSTAVGFRCGRAAASHDPTIYAQGHSWDQTGRRLIRYVGKSQHP